MTPTQLQGLLRLGMGVIDWALLSPLFSWARSLGESGKGSLSGTETERRQYRSCRSDLGSEGSRLQSSRADSMARSKAPAGKAQATPRKKSSRKLPPHLAAKASDFDPDTPLSKLEDERKAKNKRAPKESADAHVHKVTTKCIRDNFANFSEAEIHKVCHEGRTLYQTIFQDKMKAHLDAASAPKFGRHYFDDLRSLFGRSSQADLMEPSEDEAVSDALFEAVDHSRSKPPKREKLLLFCKTSAHTPNKTECIGIIQHAFELHPSHLNYNLNIEVANYLIRNDVPAKFEKQWNIYLSHLDSVLSFGYCHLRSKGWGLHSFAEAHQQLIAKVLPWESVARLLAAKGCWDGVEDDIEAVTSFANSLLGEKMFAFARVANVGARVSKLIQEEVSGALKTGALTLASVAAVREKVLSKLKDAFRSDDLDRARVISVPYLGGELVKLEVASAWDELDVRVDTCLKLLAFTSFAPGDEHKKRLLVPLFCELELCAITGEVTGRDIADELLRKFLSCRRSANSQALSVHEFSFGHTWRLNAHRYAVNASRRQGIGSIVCLPLGASLVWVPNGG